MSHPANDLIVDTAREQWEVAYATKDFTAMRAVIDMLKHANFEEKAQELASEMIDLEDALK